MRLFKVLFIALGFFYLTACSEGGLEMAIPIPEETKLKIAQFQPLPATPDGSNVIKFEPMERPNGGKIYGIALQNTMAVASGNSWPINQGEGLFLVASVETDSGFKGYIAQPASISKFFEAYVRADHIRVTSGGNNSSEEEEYEEEVPPEVVMPDPTCPEVDFAEVNRNGNFKKVSAIRGPKFRAVADDFFMLLDTEETGYTAVTIQLTNLEIVRDHQKNKNKNMPATMKSVRLALDRTKTDHAIALSDFIEKSKWHSTQIVVNLKMEMAVYDENENPVPETPPVVEECEFEERIASPLVLDFSKNQKFETTSLLESKTKFDLTRDGIKEKTGWIKKNTALLAMDRNGNGIIDNGNELFGEFTRAIDGNLHQNGYTALKELLKDSTMCTNFIESSNPYFSRLRLWFDENEDGISQKEELKTLKEMGVTAIDTNYQESPLSVQAPFQNDIKYQAKFHGPEQCGQEGCNSYDVYFAATVLRRLSKAVK